MKTFISQATLCFSVLSFASAEPTSPAEALSDALFTENVSRDVEGAAAKYADLLKEFPENKKQAVVALLRLAEIRTAQGRKEEAGLLFKRLATEHSLLEPQAEFVRRRLGKDDEKSEPRAIHQIEKDRSFNDKVYRNLWALKVTPGRKQIVKKTFTVKVDERLVPKEFAEGFTVETISHSPGQEVWEFVSQTFVREGVPTKAANPIPTFFNVSAIGQSYALPSGFLEVGSMEGQG